MKGINVLSIELEILLTANSIGTVCKDGTSRLCPLRIKSNYNTSCRHIKFMKTLFQKNNFMIQEKERKTELIFNSYHAERSKIIVFIPNAKTF